MSQDILTHFQQTILDHCKDSLLKTSFFRQIDEKSQRILLTEFESYFVGNPTETKSITKQSVSKKTQESKHSDDSGVDPTRCMCRVFNTGLGTQCKRKQVMNGFCNKHCEQNEAKELELGTIYDPVPDTYLAGKKMGSKIKWKGTIKVYSQNKTTPQENTPVSDDKIVDEIKESTLDGLLLKSEKEESDAIANDLTFDIEDELDLEGIIYEQLCVGNQEVYIINKETDMKIATWNGYTQDTIEWVNETEKENHKKRVESISTS